jgi:hypothetical protein
MFGVTSASCLSYLSAARSKENPIFNAESRVFTPSPAGCVYRTLTTLFRYDMLLLEGRGLSVLIPRCYEGQPQPPTPNICNFLKAIFSMRPRCNLDVKLDRWTAC